MKGVMRVGDLAKGLLLSNKLNIQLVVLCSEKPTKQLLQKLGDMLPPKLKVLYLHTRAQHILSISEVFSMLFSALWLKNFRTF